MADDIKLLGPNQDIPTGTWRLGIFVLNPEVMKGYSEDQVRKYIASWASRGGVSVATNSLRPLTISVPLQGAPGQVWGGWVSNTIQGLTTVQFIRRSGLPAQFAAEAAPQAIEQFLDNFQGPWAAGAIETSPVIWSTPGSVLQSDAWYVAGAAWADAVPSSGQLEERLKVGGYNLWSPNGAVRSYYIGGEPKGLMFIFRTSSSATTVAQVRDTVGAAALIVNLADPRVEPGWDLIDDLQERGDAFLASVGAATTALSEGITGAVKGAGEAIGAAGGLIRYLPYILVALGLGYLGYRGYKLKEARKQS